MTKKFSFVTTIEARMTSSRLPEKVIKKFGKDNKSYETKLSLEILVERIRRSKYVKEIIVATTTNIEDDKIVEISNNLKVKSFRGSEVDVLGRLSSSLDIVDNCDYVIQLTGDNPLIDPKIIDYIVEIFISNYPNFDFVTNNGLMNLNHHEIPLGMDVSVFSSDNLRKIASITNNEEDREHPTLFFYRGGKSIFKIYNAPIPHEWKRHYNPRLTLDTLEDFQLLNTIFDHFMEKNKVDFGLSDILNFLDKNKNLVNLNKNISHKIPSGLNEK